MKKLFYLFMIVPFLGNAQTIIDHWIVNTTGKKSSYWINTAAQGSPEVYVFKNSTDSADVLKLCYSVDSVWIKSEGMTNDMGKYKNPGSCLGQNYVFRLPRKPTVPTTKTISPKGGPIGVLLNGIPIYGITNAFSWNGTANVARGSNVWNVEVYLAEGRNLDTAFGGHPQQEGAYHTHATPFRLYEKSASSVHSPIVGFAFDGNPVYGPYGYTSPLNTASGISRMKTGYGLRNITTRTILPYGVTASQTGPPVNTTYPIGTYVEDYEWLSSNGGDLDKYNGRFCKTPEYPEGTYAYFVTIDAAGTAAFPYFVGIEYYGAPDQGNFPSPGLTANSLKMPKVCIPTTTSIESFDENEFAIYPNPSTGKFSIRSGNSKISNIEIYSSLGELVYVSSLNSATTDIELNVKAGVYFVKCYSGNGISSI